MKFPKQAKSNKYISSILEQRLNEIPNWSGRSGIFRFGFAMTEPHPIALKVYSDFIKLSNNNVGMHTTSEKAQLSGTRLLEVEVIEMLADLLNGDTIDGNITSGGSEGNITGIWMGRNLLKSKGLKKICLIISELTHSSFIKAANLLDIDVIVLPIGENYGLNKSIVNNFFDENFEKYDGFIFGLTAGYYSCGSSDDIQGVGQYLFNKFKSFNNKSFYIHVDSCFGGFIYPFSDPNFPFDFRNIYISSMSIDPHKMGLMPYSCGVFLCRKGLVSSIEIVNEQVKLIDRTLIGSRPGATAASLWALINTLGHKEYKKIINSCLSNKIYLIDQIRKIDNESKLISFNNINNFAVCFSLFPDNKLPDVLENQYRIVPNKLPLFENMTVVYKNFYHFYTMPYITKLAIDGFVKDIKKLSISNKSNRSGSKKLAIPRTPSQKG